MLCVLNGQSLLFRQLSSQLLRRGLLSRFRGGARSALDPAGLISALDEWALWKRFGL